MDATAIQEVIETHLVVVFSKNGCIFCDKLKNEMKSLSIPYHEVNFSTYEDPDDYVKSRDSLIGISCQKTFPQLFINKAFKGGYTEFLKMLATGQLEKLLEQFGITITYEF